MTEMQTSFVALGYDALPSHVVARANRVLAVAEAKIAMLEEGLVDVSELDDYEWIVDEEATDPEVTEHLVLTVRVKQRVA
jgi:hypothetical protein